MRALVLLLGSVVLLAIVQFSYTAASSKWFSTAGENDGDNQSHMSSVRKHRGEGHNRHDHPHETGHHGYNKFSPSLDEISKYKDHISKLKDNDNMSPPSYKPFVPPYIEPTHKQGRYDAQEVIRNGGMKVSQDTPVIRVERVERPRKSLDTRKNRNKYRKDQHAIVRQRTSAGGENNHHNLKMKPKHLKKTDKKESKKTRKQCVGDKECNGGCCVPAKNGKKHCKKASIKESGEKCASSCVCKSELRCFVGEYKRNGGTKAHKDKKRILGRCINPDLADYNNGYFVDEIQMIQ